MDEVIGHRFGQVGPAVKQRHQRSAAGEPDGGLPGGVAAADDGHTRGAAKLRLRRSGRVKHAHALVVRELVDGKSPVGSAGSKHDGARGDVMPLFESNEVASIAGLELDRAEGSRGSCAELSRLADGAARELRAADACGETEIVLDPP